MNARKVKMATTPSDVRSEPLCFIQNNVSSITSMNLVTWLCGFYSVEELTEAKSALFSVAESLKLAG